jgi:hypothetical protein
MHLVLFIKDFASQIVSNSGHLVSNSVMMKGNVSRTGIEVKSLETNFLTVSDQQEIRSMMY